MFQIGDMIVYGGEGVCKVEGIGCPNIPHINKDRIYYTLTPLYREGKTYTPVDTPVFMRPVISRDMANEIILQIPEIEENMCEDKNLRVLNEHYREAFLSYDCKDLLQLIKTVWSKREKVEKKGRKLGHIDEQYMKRAEDMLYGEFAVALGIEKNEVKDYIKQAIEGPEGVKGELHAEIDKPAS